MICCCTIQPQSLPVQSLNVLGYTDLHVAASVVKYTECPSQNVHIILPYSLWITPRLENLFGRLLLAWVMTDNTDTQWYTKQKHLQTHPQTHLSHNYDQEQTNNKQHQTNINHDAMGNATAKEFNDTFDEVKTFVERTIRHHQGNNKNEKTALLVRREYVDQDTEKLLFRIDYNEESEDDPTLARSVAVDAQGCILYADKVVVNKKEKQKQVLIYTTSPVFQGQCAAKDTRISKGDPNNVYLAAVIFYQTTTTTKYLCIVTGEDRFDDTGFELRDLYKAMKNPMVLKNNGIVVADMEGHVVGKAKPPKRRLQLQRSSSSSSCASASENSSHSCTSSSTTGSASLSASFSSFLTSMGEKKATRYEVAAGANAAAVIAVAFSLLHSS
jgi:hypothetical protein